MTRMIFALGGAAAAVVVVALIALGIYFNQPGIGGPPVASPTPGPVATPTPEMTAAPTLSPDPEAALFVSDRYGYSLRLPDENWRVIEQAGVWAPGITFGPDEAGVDTMLHLGDPRYGHMVFLNSQRLDADTSFDEWLQEYDQMGRTYFPNCRDSGAYETATVDGVEARIGTAVCDASRWAEALWVHGDRVYSLRVGEDPFSTVPIDPRQEIEEWLERITLTE